MKREEVKQDVKDNLSPGCHFYEVGSFFLEVCPMEVFVTHESGKSMVFSLKDVETRTHYHKVDLIPKTEEQKFKEKSAYYKQHAIWSTEDGELEYMFGNGETRKYSIGTLEGDIAEKISHVLTFLDDQSTYERYDRFSDDGIQEFACEYGYGFSCSEGPNIFKVVKSFKHTDKCITIPVSDYEEEVSAWVCEGISEEDLPLLENGEFPYGYR